MTSKLFVIWVVLMASLVSVSAMAQTNTTTSKTDHWSSYDDCNAAVGNNTAIPYIPGINNPQTADTSKGEELLYSPTGWCNLEYSKYGVVHVYYPPEQPVLKRGEKFFDTRCNNRVPETRKVVLPPVTVHVPTPTPTPVVPTTQAKTETETKVVPAGSSIVYNTTINYNTTSKPVTGDGDNGNNGGGGYDNSGVGGSQAQYGGFVVECYPGTLGCPYQAWPGMDIELCFGCWHGHDGYYYRGGGYHGGFGYCG